MDFHIFGMRIIKYRIWLKPEVHIKQVYYTSKPITTLKSSNKEDVQITLKSSNKEDVEQEDDKSNKRYQTITTRATGCGRTSAA